MTAWTRVEDKRILAIGLFVLILYNYNWNISKMIVGN